MENSNNKSKVISALMVGTVVGAAVGILFAPNKGKKTRQNIAKGTQNLANSAKDLTNDLAQQASNSYSNVMNKAEKASNYVDNQSTAFKNDFKQKI